LFNLVHLDGETVLLGMSFLKHVEMMQKDKQLTLRLKPKQAASVNKPF